MNTADLKIITGTKKVLFTAPHAKIHKRPKLSMGYKQAELFTDDIVEKICQNTGAWGIILTSTADYDPNYHKEKRNEFKQEVRRIVKENKIKYFFDIHGVLDDKQYDLGLYYKTQYSRSIKLANLLREDIGKDKLYGISTSILRFLDNDQETLGEFVASKLRVPAIQIEIAKYIRVDEDLRECFIKNVSDIVNKRFV